MRNFPIQVLKRVSCMTKICNEKARNICWLLLFSRKRLLLRSWLTANGSRMATDTKRCLTNTMRMNKERLIDILLSILLAAVMERWQNKTLIRAPDMALGT